MPEGLAHMALMDTPSSAVPEVEDPGKKGAISLDSVDEMKDNLKSFTDSVHQKASQVIHWMQQVEPHQTDSSKKCLVCFAEVVQARFFFGSFYSIIS